MSIAIKKQQQPATPTPEKPAPARPPRLKRRLTAFAIVLLGLVLLVGLLPTILAHTSLMPYFIRRAAMLEGTITFRSTSIGWFSSASVSDIVICDAQGETVLEADRLTCDRSLLKLLLNSSNVGTLRIEKPRLSAKLTRDGSNVESVLARWLIGPSSSSSQGIDLSVEVVDGSATILDQETQQNWRVTDLQFAMDMSRRLTWPTRMEGVATVDDRGHPGGLAFKLHLKASDTPPADPAAWCGLAGTDGDLSLQTTTLPLTIFQRLAARGIPGLKLDGTLGSTIEARWTGSTNVQLNGVVSYPWDKLSLLLQPYTGTSIQFFGTGTIPFAYRGPLSPAQGEASAAVQFSGANVYGFQVGPGVFKVRMANGVLLVDPLEVTCNQGRVALQSELRMDRQPMEFRLSAGTLASQIQLDQAACHSALKFVAPVLASATQSQGQFSILLDGCRIPIGDLNRAEIAGRMIVHSATVSPGPLVQQLASLLTTSPALVRIQPESVIQFRMTGGRIYHQGLALEFPEVTMQTYGSVGLDESLRLMVETSVPLKWLPKNAVIDAIKKQRLQIPVGGTLKSPQLDLGELARSKNQILGNLTRSVLQSELGNQLNRFLQPQK